MQTLRPFAPSSAVLRANAPVPVDYENDNCELKVLTMHRPTHIKSAEVMGDYPFSWHFKGRKRLWEIRVQCRFKRPPKGTPLFGIEAMDYVPSSAAGRMVMKMLIGMVKAVAGSDIYKSSGDDPAATDGEVEPPTFAMPLWACDQLIVSQRGEEPDLTGSLEGLGILRSDGVKAYMKELSEKLLEASPDKVYTFGIWGISRFLDCISWEVCNVVPGRRIPFDSLGGTTPMNIVCYELDEEMCTPQDRRHLRSRKNYFFSVALWSGLRPPAQHVLEDLGIREHEDDGPPAPKKTRARGSWEAFACCAGSRGYGYGDEAMGG